VFSRYDCDASKKVVSPPLPLALTEGGEDLLTVGGAVDLSDVDDAVGFRLAWLAVGDAVGLTEGKAEVLIEGLAELFLVGETVGDLVG